MIDTSGGLIFEMEVLDQRVGVGERLRLMSASIVR
jgi:hypothetical protein